MSIEEEEYSSCSVALNEHSAVLTNELHNESDKGVATNWLVQILSSEECKRIRIVDVGYCDSKSNSNSTTEEENDHTIQKVLLVAAAHGKVDGITADREKAHTYFDVPYLYFHQKSLRSFTITKTRGMHTQDLKFYARRISGAFPMLKRIAFHHVKPESVDDILLEICHHSCSVNHVSLGITKDFSGFKKLLSRNIFDRDKIGDDDQNKRFFDRPWILVVVTRKNKPEMGYVSPSQLNTKMKFVIREFRKRGACIVFSKKPLFHIPNASAAAIQEGLRRQTLKIFHTALVPKCNASTTPAKSFLQSDGDSAIMRRVSDFL